MMSGTPSELGPSWWRGSRATTYKNLHKGKDMRCQGCMLEVDTQSHVLHCIEYEDLRGDMDLEKDEDMVKYFREVLKRRMKE